MKWPWVSRALYEQVLAASAQFLHDKQIAEDRLYAAWKEGHTIPPRAAVERREPDVVTLLPEKLHAFVQNWESPETRADLEREARALLKHNFTEERVLDLWAARQGDGARE